MLVVDRSDEYFDAKYGSQTMFLGRGFIAFIALFIIQYALIWTTDETAMITLFALLGLSSWWLHGTATMLASMFPKNVIAYLQVSHDSTGVLKASN